MPAYFCRSLALRGMKYGADALSAQGQQDISHPHCKCCFWVHVPSREAAMHLWMSKAKALAARLCQRIKLSVHLQCFLGDETGQVAVAARLRRRKDQCMTARFLAAADEYMVLRRRIFFALLQG